MRCWTLHKFFGASQTGYQFSINWWSLCVLLALQAPVVCAEDNGLAGQRERMQSIESYASATNGLGSWIWEAATHDDQTCRLWKTFEIPAGAKVAKSRLVITVDNEFALYLDGRKLGHGSEWRELFVFDLTPILTPGRHVLAVDCYNGSFYGGMILGLRIDLTDGRSIVVKSDEGWKVVPTVTPKWETLTKAGPDWPAATVEAPLGGNPWWSQPMAVNLMASLQPITVFFWQTGWFQITLSVVCFVVILTSLWLVTQLIFHRKERHILEQERTRIARDIHDDMGGRLTQLVVHVEVAQNELPPDAEMRSQLTWVCSEMRGLLSTMDEVLWVVNPRCDTLSDFVDYVCNYAHEFLKPTQIQCFFDVDPKMSAAPFNFPLRRSLLMAVKEALNNALKHSGATELHLQIHWQDPRLIVVIRDNGRGFDPNTIKPRRHGLVNLTQRMRDLDGRCQINSRPGEGCRVELDIPLRRSLRFLWLRMLREKLASSKQWLRQRGPVADQARP